MTAYTDYYPKDDLYPAADIYGQLVAPFPQGPLDFRASVYLGAANGGWSDCSPFVYQRQPVQVTRGRQNESAQVSPAQAQFTVNNRDNRFSVRSPSSPWFGQLRQNSPFRLSVPAALAGLPSAGLRMEDDAASFAWTPDLTPKQGRFVALAAQGGNTGTAAATLVLSVLNAVAAGNTVIGFIKGSSSDAVTGVTDTKSNTWHVDKTESAIGPTGAIVRCNVTTALTTSDTITVTFAGSNNDNYASLSQYLGVLSLDTGGAATVNWSSATSATVTATSATTGAADLIIAGVGTGGATAETFTFTALTPSALAVRGTSNGFGVMLDTLATGAVTPSFHVAYGTAAIGVGLIASYTGAAAFGGTLDLKIDLNLSGYGSCALLSQWGNTLHAWSLSLADNGNITLAHDDSGGGPHDDSASLPLPLGRLALWVSLNLVAQTLTFSTAPTMAGPFTQLGAVIPTTATTLRPGGGQNVLIGGGGFLPSVTGTIYEASVAYNGVVVADAVFTAQAPGASFFTDAQGNTWNVSGTAEISGQTYRFHGELASLPKAADPSGRDIYSNAGAWGILNRLQQQQNPTNSSMYRGIVRLSVTADDANGNLIAPLGAPVAYWPCEDGQNATQIGAAIGGLPGSFTGGATLGQNSDFACSAPLPTIGSSVWTFPVPSFFGTWTDNLVRLLFEWSAGDIPNNTVLARVFTTGTAAWFDLVYLSGFGGALELIAFAADGTSLGSSVGPENLDGGQLRVSLALIHQPGGGFQLQPESRVVGGAGQFSTSSTIAGSVGAVKDVQVNPGGVNLANVVFGHVSVQAVYTTIGDVKGPLNAWAGETAGDRYARLCAEEGINCRIYGHPGLSETMGTQTLQTIPALLQEIEYTDMGYQSEPRSTLGLGYVTRTALYNQAPLATADYSLAELGAAFSATADDQLTLNDVTVTSADGSSARVTLDIGNMSTQPPPAGIGRVDTSQQVNPAQDSDLQNLASWLLHVRSVDDDRYPSLPFGMNRAETPAVVAQLDTGSYLQVVNTPSWIPPGPLKQLGVGTSETFMEQPLWTLAINGVPESPYEVAVVGTAIVGESVVAL